MFALGYNITVGKYRFKGINAVNDIKRSINSTLGTATIKVPINAVIRHKDGTNLNVLTAQAIKRGDPVTIELAYNGKFKKEFSGFVSRINYNRPLEIECENAIFLLKQKNICKIFKDTTLDAVLKDICEGTGIKYTTGGETIKVEKLLLCDDQKQPVDRATALNYTIEQLCLSGFFNVDNLLFVGLRQGLKNGKVKYRLGWNTIKDDDLKRHYAEDEKVLIKVFYFDSKGKKHSYNFGDKDGCVKTIHLDGVRDIKTIEKLAKNELAKYKFNGFEGKINGFLQPFCDVGYVANVIDEQYNERTNESYYCEGVEVNFDTNGARRKSLIGAIV